MASVRISRPRGFRDALRSYGIEADGAKVASIRNGGTIQIELPPGRHVLRASLAYIEGTVGSAPLEVLVEADETIELLVEPIGRLILKPGDARGREESALKLSYF